MRFPAAALIALLLVAARPLAADTATPPGDDAAGSIEGGAEIAACIDAAKRRDADATIASCSRALDAGHLGAAPTVAALINRGLAHISKNEPAAAIPDFDQAIQLRPDSVAFYDMRALAHAMQGEAAPALGDYAEVISRGAPETADDAEHALRAGIAQHFTGDDTAAAKLFAQAQRLATEGSTVELQALLWRHLALLGSRQNAIMPLDAALAGRDLTQWPGPLLQYYQGRITEKALEEGFESGSSVTPEQACQATFYIAARALADGRFNVAKDGFAHAQPLCAPGSVEFVAARAEAVVAAQPVPADLSNAMFQCQAADANGDTGPIIEYCSQAVDRLEAPDVWRQGALTRRAAAYYRNGDLDHAIADLDAALALRPDAFDVYRQRADYRLEKGEISGGVADLAYALTLQPDYVSAYVDRGWIRVSAHDLEGAFADFSRAVEIQPELPRLHLARGVVAFLSGDDQQAAADFSAVIQASGQAPYAVLWLAVTEQRHPGDDGGMLETGMAALNLYEWPGPLVRFVRGELSADDLAAAAADPDPQTAGKQDCEASFYTGLKAALHGDKATAKPLLEHAHSACSSENLEYHAAAAVLAD